VGDQDITSDQDLIIVFFFLVVFFFFFHWVVFVSAAVVKGVYRAEASDLK
jgi:hypothetical protein